MSPSSHPIQSPCPPPVISFNPHVPLQSPSYSPRLIDQIDNKQSDKVANEGSASVSGGHVMFVFDDGVNGSGILVELEDLGEMLKDE